VRVKLERPHSKTPEIDYHEWVLLAWDWRNDPAGYVYRDAIGRRNNGGYHRWLQVTCNNPDCTGRAIVCEGAIDEAINEALPCPRPAS
jgi:hypothetical protein